MSRKHAPGVTYVVGPDGSPLTVANLPKSTAGRWDKQRKSKVVAAVLGGLITLDDACERYSLTVEEFLSWKESLASSDE